MYEKYATCVINFLCLKISAFTHANACILNRAYMPNACAIIHRYPCQEVATEVVETEQQQHINRLRTMMSSLSHILQEIEHF